MKKLFKCNGPKVTLTIVDLPRQSWRVLPPKPWQIALTLTVIVVVSIVWGILP